MSAYLIYLSHLPYKEQLYWKLYNENPKTDLSARAIETDFQGRWREEVDPLNSLKRTLQELHRTNVLWWQLDQTAYDNVHYPYTDSSDEWSNEFLNLDQLIIEGFRNKWLRSKAKSMSDDFNVQYKSLKTIEIILISKDVSHDAAKGLMKPLKDVHELRTKLKGHLCNNDKKMIKRTFRTDEQIILNYVILEFIS